MPTVSRLQAAKDERPHRRSRLVVGLLHLNGETTASYRIGGKGLTKAKINEPDAGVRHCIHIAERLDPA
jgi:hypothetical protein